MKRVTIDPMTRLEGHGRIEIFLDDEGNVQNTYVQVVELRGFEKFCEGRPGEEIPRIVTRICGVCPEAHHLASVKALDRAFNLQPPPAAEKLRELLLCAHYIHSHIAHFYLLASPDFVLGPDSDPAQRNILGVISRVGLELGQKVIKRRADAQWIQEVIGGKATHPVCAVPGGMSKPITAEERAGIAERAAGAISFARESLALFDELVLGNPAYLEMITSPEFTTPLYNMGLVDSEKRVNFYDGKLRVVDPEGAETALFDAADYLDFISEWVEPWTYLKFPYLRTVGWAGLKGGAGSGIYRVAPLGRLNAAAGMATPLADEAYRRMFETLGGRPAHHTLAAHWARLIELLYAAERCFELVGDEEITSRDLRQAGPGTPGEGIGVVEAPRGTLIHHYRLDSKGMVESANIIVGTTNNYGSICTSVKQAAAGLISKGRISEGLKNRIEMLYRAYDPCLSCATHVTGPGGETGPPVIVRGHDGRVVARL